MKLSIEMQKAIDNPATHNYLKMILKETEGKDICDILNDLEYAQLLCNNHLDETLKALGNKLDGSRIV